MATLNFFTTGVSTAVKTYTANTPIDVRPKVPDATDFVFTDATGDKCVTSNLPYIVEN